MLAALNRQYLDGIVLHGSLEGLPLLELVEEIQAAGSPYVPPVLLITMHPITTEEEMDLARLNRTSMVKPVNSLDRLLEESVLLLHRAEFVLRPEQTRKLEMLRMNDPALTGKHVLVVDDDVRNIFALTSLLEDHNLVVVHAENGRAGIELLESSPHIDIVLMDIMMPGMDGYETMRAIREIPRFRTLPIIALTAKAMKGDRAKCLEAGASDYITKPVDLEQLFSVLRVWLTREYEPAQASVGSN